jgi:hypothetical protein
MNHLIRLKTAASPLLTMLALVSFGLLPKAQAVNPPPDGGYANLTTAEGTNALNSLTSGAANTGVGWFSLSSVSTGSFNTGVGAGTLALNTADSNTATGVAALLLNTAGTENTANGTATLVNNSTGSFNSAFGAFALNNNVDGDDNTATGDRALFSNTIGVDNTASGFQALFSNDTGNENVASGIFALFSNTSGGFNTAIGEDALVNNTTGIGNIALGAEAGVNLTEGDNNIDIGSLGVAGDSKTIRIGIPEQTRTFIAGIRDVTTGNDDAIPVVIDSAGQLGTASSSKRFKKEIKPMESASEAILALKPVTFHYNSDSTGTPQFGLIAEDVAKVNPDLVVRDKNGEIYTVRYDAVNAMLLNEFLKEHRKMEEQQAAITELKSIVTQQQKEFQAAVAEQRKQFEARLKRQDANIQRVSDQLELSKPAPQMVGKN